jgi:archaellum component FlaC
LLEAVGDVVDELEGPETLDRPSDPLGIYSLADRMTVIDARFNEVARDLDGIKRELARARSERVEDLALLVDLLTTSWRAADSRLARIDRKLDRM